MKKGFFTVQSDQVPPEGLQNKKRGRRSPTTGVSNRAPKPNEDPCSVCGLCGDERLSNPKIEPWGGFKKKGMVFGEGPGEVEDRMGRPFVGDTGELFRGYFVKYGLDFDQDFVVVNAIDCRKMDKKGTNAKPSKKELKLCWPRKEAAIIQYQPSVIFLLGDSAIDSFYGGSDERRFFSGLLLSSYRGKVIPDQTTGAWICHSYHPAFLLRGNKDMEPIFDLDFRVFVSMLGKPRPTKFAYSDNIMLLYEEQQVLTLLRGMLKSGKPFAFDYETSSFRYYERIHEIYLISVSSEDGKGAFVFSPTESILNMWKTLLESDVPKVAQNIKHEIQASHYVLGIEPNNMIFCTMLAAHVLDGTKGVTNLKKQVYIRYGVPDYGQLLKPFMEAGPKEKNRFAEVASEPGTRRYCGRDSLFCNKIAKTQQRQLKAQGMQRAYDLFHRGALAYSQIERNGIKIDVDLALKLQDKWGQEIEELKDKLFSCEEARTFEQKVGRPLLYKEKLSDTDLRVLLFDVLKFKPTKETKTTFSVDNEVLKQLEDKSELIGYELRSRKLSKMRGTYLAQFLRYEVNGFLYPTFNLHFARSYRSSSDSPNFQNIPKRDEEALEIRRVIISRWMDGELWEVDYGSMEVRILACQSRDPALVDYIIGGGDMHADWAEEMFLVRKEDCSKDEFKKLRFIAKNGWVFPLFYGSYYKSVAKSVEPLDSFYSTLSKGQRMEKWEEHLKGCERKFWGQFRGVREWQDRKIKEYQRKGYVDDGVWGFRRQGYLSRNKIYNFPIQGPAFHCLQWSINRLILDVRSKWESLLCGQIHDAGFFDGKKHEFSRVRGVVDRVMIDDVREDQPWIIVPLITEWSRGKNWLEMKEES